MNHYRFGGWGYRTGKRHRALVAVTVFAVLSAIALVALSIWTGGEGVVYPSLAYHSQGYNVEPGKTTIAIDGGEEGFGSIKLDVGLHIYKDQWFCVRMVRLCGPKYSWWFDIHFEGTQATTADFGPECYCYQIQGRDLYLKWIHVAGAGTGRAVYRPEFYVLDQPLPGCEPPIMGW